MYMQLTGKEAALQEAGVELRRRVEVVDLHCFAGALGMLAFPPSLLPVLPILLFLLSLPAALHRSSALNSRRPRT